MTAYYNELDPFAAAWLRELIAEGLIAGGVVDERSILEVQPADLEGFIQCHFFAGVAGWSRALRLADWPDDRPVWTGSCPCQPFSAAGKRRGADDARHLWPEFARLIGECNPPVVFGEQVASKDGRDWLAGVRADLEGMVYAVGAADLCAAGVGAPHIRQRLFWVADRLADAQGATTRPRNDVCTRKPDAGSGGGALRLADSDEGQRGRLADGEGRDHDGAAAGRQQGDGIAEPGGAGGGLEHATGDGREQRRAEPGGRGAPGGRQQGGPGFWSNTVWHPCSDGKARRIAAGADGVEPGIFPLASGVPNRVGTLRGAGNAIVPQIAAEFIQAYLDVL